MEQFLNIAEDKYAFDIACRTILDKIIEPDLPQLPRHRVSAHSDTLKINTPPVDIFIHLYKAGEKRAFSLFYIINPELSPTIIVSNMRRITVPWGREFEMLCFVKETSFSELANFASVQMYDSYTQSYYTKRARYVTAEQFQYEYVPTLKGSCVQTIRDRISFYHNRCSLIYMIDLLAKNMYLPDGISSKLHLRTF